MFTSEAHEFHSLGREFDQYDIDSAYASAAAAQFACAQMVERIASNAYAARSYPDGRVLISREVGQPDDETTLVFDLSIALHYSDYAISGADKLWVSSPHASEERCLECHCARTRQSQLRVPPTERRSQLGNVGSRNHFKTSIWLLRESE